MAEFPHLRVSGKAGERGEQLGQQAADRIRLNVEVYGDLFRHYTGLSWRQIQEYAARFREPIRAYQPRYLDEIQREHPRHDLADVPEDYGKVGCARPSRSLCRRGCLEDTCGSLRLFDDFEDVVYSVLIAIGKLSNTSEAIIPSCPKRNAATLPAKL